MATKTGDGTSMARSNPLRINHRPSETMQWRMLFCGFLALVAILMSPIDAGAQTPARKAAPKFDSAGAAQQIIALTNRERAQRGIAPLKVDRRCVMAITSHVEDMARGGFLSHQGRDGRGANERYRKYDPASRGAGENLAYNTTGTGNSFMRQWMGSSGHRNNILSGNYKGIGVAVRSHCTRGDEVRCYYYAGQCFSL